MRMSYLATSGRRFWRARGVDTGRTVGLGVGVAHANDGDTQVDGGEYGQKGRRQAHQSDTQSTAAQQPGCRRGNPFLNAFHCCRFFWALNGLGGKKQATGRQSLSYFYSSSTTTKQQNITNTIVSRKILAFNTPIHMRP